MIDNLVPNGPQLSVAEACQISQIPLELLTLRQRKIAFRTPRNNADRTSSPPPLKKVKPPPSLNKQHHAPFYKYHYDSL